MDKYYSLTVMSCLLCIFGIVTPALSEDHPSFPAIVDGAMIQLWDGVHNIIVDAFDVQLVRPHFSVSKLQQ